MAYAPLVGQDGGSPKSDLPDGSTGIFLSEGLDRFLPICPSGQFVAPGVSASSLRREGNYERRRRREPPTRSAAKVFEFKFIYRAERIIIVLPVWSPIPG
jgi:hypothetical protein